MTARSSKIDEICAVIDRAYSLLALGFSLHHGEQILDLQDVTVCGIFVHVLS